MKQVKVLLLVLVIVFLAGCQSNANQPAAQAAVTQPAAANTAEPVRANDRIVAEGEVEPIQYTSLNFSVTGIVAEVLAKEGDVVQAGQVIARLKGNARLQASISSAEVELLSAQQALDKLNRNANLVRAETQLRVAQTNKALDKAQEDRESKNYRRAEQSVVDNSKAQLIVAEDSFKRAEESWAYFEGKDENDVNRAEALTQLSKARQERDRAKANFNYVSENPDEFEVAVAEGELVVAKAKYESALADWELVKNGVNPDDLSLAEARYENAKTSLDAAKKALEDQELVAPISGTIITSDIKVGEFVGPQSRSLLMADLTTYQVKTTDLTELSVVGIKEGTPVRVSFDAVPGLELTGKVVRINNLGEEKQGDITYTVFVQLDQQDARLRWKMTASIVFETE